MRRVDELIRQDVVGSTPASFNQHKSVFAQNNSSFILLIPRIIIHLALTLPHKQKRPGLYARGVLDGLLSLLSTRRRS